MLNKIGTYLLAFAVILLFAGPAIAAISGRPNIGIVKSRDNASYSMVEKGFRYLVSETHPGTNYEVYVLDNSSDLENIAGRKFDIILTIGREAAVRVSERIDDIPVIVTAVLNPGKNLADRKNVSIFSLDIPPKKQLSIMQETLPARKRVGIIYDPDQNEAYVKSAKTAATELGITLKAFPVSSAREVPKVRAMDVEVLWIIPDTTVCQIAIIRRLLIDSLKNNVAAMAFSPSYVKAGALLGITHNYSELGENSGRLALEMLRKEGLLSAGVIYSHCALIYLNEAVAKTMRITIPRKITEKAQQVFGR
ncbi:MAG: ABC transporter substrate binding protein [Thermodesulfobacteriota bacterium]